MLVVKDGNNSLYHLLNEVLCTKTIDAVFKIRFFIDRWQTEFIKIPRVLVIHVTTTLFNEWNESIVFRSVIPKGLH